MKDWILTLILPVFATSREPGQPAHPYGLIRLYTAGYPTSSFHLDIPKRIKDSAKNGRWIIPFKKFGRLKVNENHTSNILLKQRRISHQSAKLSFE